MLKNFPMEIGKTIRELREERKLTLEDLAFEADVTPSYISRIERGERRIPNTTLEKIAAALGYTASQLYIKSEGNAALNIEDDPQRTHLDKKLGQLRQIARELSIDNLSMLVDIAKTISKHQA